MACEELFLRELRERGFRMTPQREMVLSAMHQMDGLVTAEDVHRRVQKMSTSVDISTVYRTLDLLQQLELVASLDTGGGQRVYELRAGHGHHAHLVCRSCGAVIGVEMGQFEELAEALHRRFGFQIDRDNLSFSGQCLHCLPERP
jgi:Fur family transcriptional regulator, ferric uptake regulator